MVWYFVLGVVVGFVPGLLVGQSRSAAARRGGNEGARSGGKPLVWPGSQSEEPTGPDAPAPASSRPASVPEREEPSLGVDPAQPEEPKVAKAKAPEVKAPEVKAPEVKAPEVKAPELKAPEVKAPEVKAPEVKAPELKAPELKAPELKAPELKAPELKAPELKAPELKAPELKAPEPSVAVSAPAPVGLSEADRRALEGAVAASEARLLEGLEKIRASVMSRSAPPSAPTPAAPVAAPAVAHADVAYEHTIGLLSEPVEGELRQEFARMLADYEARGWEFHGLGADYGGAQGCLMVFRRPRES